MTETTQQRSRTGLILAAPTFLHAILSAQARPDDEDQSELSTPCFAATPDDDPLVAAEAVTALGRAGADTPAYLKRLSELKSVGGALGSRAKVALERLSRSTKAAGE